MSEAASPLFQPDPLTRSFWRACARRELRVARCGDCGHLFLPPGPCCPLCWSPELGSQLAAGNGRIFSYAVYRRTYHEAFPAPYVVALVELDEGPRLITNIVGCAPEEVVIEMRVRVRFEERAGLTLPLFEPAASGGGAP